MRGPEAFLTSHSNRVLSSPAEARRWSEIGDQASAMTDLECARRVCVMEPDAMSHSVTLDSPSPTAES